jgi:glutamate/tyrosine decarboxylase-like PLP-dependent enzyme
MPVLFCVKKAVEFWRKPMSTKACLFQASSPACTELETVVMNWLGKMIGLPEEFLHTRINSTGGGVIQVSTEETTVGFWNSFKC